MALYSQMIPPVRVVNANMTPRNVTEPQRGTYVYDFGQNFRFVIIVGTMM